MHLALNIAAQMVHVRQLNHCIRYIEMLRKTMFFEKVWDDGGKFLRNICTSSRENTFTITNNYDQFTKRKLML